MSPSPTIAPVPASSAPPSVSTTPPPTQTAPAGPGPLAKLISISKASPTSALAQQTMQYIKQGAYDEEAQKEGIDLSWAGRPKAPAPAPKAPSELSDFISNTKAAGEAGIQAGSQGLQEGEDALAENNGSLTGELGTGAKLAGAGVDTGLGTIGTLFSPLAGAIQTLSQNASDNPHVQKFAEAMSPILDAANMGVSSMQELEQKYPTVAKNAQRAVGVASLLGGDEAVDPITGLAKGSVQKAADIASSVGSAASAGKQAVEKAADGLASDLSKAGEGSGILAKGVRRVQDAAAAKQAAKTLPQEVQDAIKADLPKPVAEFVHNATDEEKKAFSTMLDHQEKGVSTLGPAPRAEDVIGARILAAVKHIAGVNKDAGEKEGTAVDYGLTGSPVNIAKTVNQFKDALASLNVKIGKSADLTNLLDDKDRLDFSNSEFKGPSTSKDRGMLQSVWDEIKPDNGSTIKDGKDVHIGRQSIFNELAGRPKDDPFSAKTTKIAENARSGLLHDIADQSPGGSSYRDAATTFAKTQKTLSDFYSLLGKKWAGKPDDVLGLKAGEVFNRVKGNASANANDVLNRVESLAKENGFKSNVDPRNLVEFNQVLKKFVGDTQSASLAGNITRGVDDALPHGAEVALHGLTGNLVGAGKAAIKFASGNSRAEQIRALRNLIGPTSSQP